MPQLIGALIVLILYCGALYVFFVFVVPMIAAAGAVAAVGIMLYLHTQQLRATIGRTARVKEGTEPAIKQYFYSAAWRELRLSIEKTQDEAVPWCRNAFALGTNCFSKEPGPVTYPLGIGLVLAAVASVFVGYVLFGITIALHTLVLAVCLAASATVVGVLRLTELLSMAVRRIYLVCPSRDCHRPISLPVYRCPKCAAQHKALLPGSYGAIRRQCQCGRLLPTLFIFGRSRIPAFCPHASCEKPLSEAIGSARNVHIPVVGGPFVGKTAFLTAAMLEIKRRRTARMTFTERADQMAFEAASDRFAKGITVDKTGGASPNAMLVRVEDARQDQSLLYIYDAAGELYADMSNLRRQNFFTHAHAIALLVDPFSMHAVRVDRAREIAALEPAIRASNELPQDVYARLVMTVREQRGGSRLDVPLAIIVTKVDAVGIEAEIESIRASLEAAAQPKDRKAVDPVRKWLLQHGEGNLVQSAEHDFKRVRYFACSALGRMPSAAATQAFVSRGVLAPFQWLAETNGVRLQ